jgi:hypothetical protein
MVGAIVFVVGCILQGLSFYLLYYNWFYEEASNIGFSLLIITSAFIWTEGLALLKIKSGSSKKSVKSLCFRLRIDVIRFQCSDYSRKLFVILAFQHFRDRCLLRDCFL